MLTRAIPLVLVVLLDACVSSKSAIAWPQPWIVGEWEWTNADGAERIVQTFAEDGRWTLELHGGASTTSPQSGRWRVERQNDKFCMVIFTDVPELPAGWVGQYELLSPKILQPLDLTDLRTYTRVESVK